MGEGLKRNIVVSAINIFEGGPLAILKKCLSDLQASRSEEFNIIALVNKKETVGIPGIQYYEFPNSRKTWLHRLYHEYVYFKGLSRKLEPRLWLSLHDITPNVEAEIRAVYCHNPAPFYKIALKDFVFEPTFGLFNLFYKYLYSINLKKNDHIIVQQENIRALFKNNYGVDNVIVAYPENDRADGARIADDETFKSPASFIFPAFPRVFKNYELIGEAVKLLIKEGVDQFRVYFTISGDENRYSKYIYREYGPIRNVRFLGVLKRDELERYYHEADCLLFPSKLETWGLPITEFKKFGKPMLLADLNYAHETLGSYGRVRFFNPAHPRELADLMRDCMTKKISFQTVEAKIPGQPFAYGWPELFNLLLNNGKRAR